MSDSQLMLSVALLLCARGGTDRVREDPINRGRAVRPMRQLKLLPKPPGLPAGTPGRRHVSRRALRVLEPGTEERERRDDGAHDARHEGGEALASRERREEHGVLLLRARRGVGTPSCARARSAPRWLLTRARRSTHLKHNRQRHDVARADGRAVV